MISPSGTPPRIRKAFLPGAGLGTRLRPLTDILPKPLVPFYHQPLIFRTLDKCKEAGIEEVMINIHHLAEVWKNVFPTGEYKGMKIFFSYEPILMDTGGGIKKVADWIGDDHILLCNADNITDLSFEEIIRFHLNSGLPASLLLRKEGYHPNVGYDEKSKRIIDMRHALGVNDGTHQFTGIYCLSPEVLTLIPDNEIVSIVEAFLQLIPQEKVGAIEQNDGFWLDLGTPDLYMAAHQQVPGQKIHPLAQISPDAELDSSCIVGPGAIISEHCRLRNCIVWPDVMVPPGSIGNGMIFYC